VQYGYGEKFYVNFMMKEFPANKRFTICEYTYNNRTHNTHETKTCPDSLLVFGQNVHDVLTVSVV
jgi:hypothetical protein